MPDFLTERPDGAIVLTGHRVGLYHVVRYYNEGYSPEMLVEQFPTLPLAHVHKVIAFYLENRDAVDAYVARVRDELDRQRAVGRRVDLAELRVGDPWADPLQQFRVLRGAEAVGHVRR